MADKSEIMQQLYNIHVSFCDYYGNNDIKMTDLNHKHTAVLH